VTGRALASSRCIAVGSEDDLLHLGKRRDLRRNRRCLLRARPPVVSVTATPVSGEPMLREAAQIDGSGWAVMGTGCPRTRGHIDVGHAPEVPA
jgi:hypothetical protein